MGFSALLAAVTEARAAVVIAIQRSFALVSYARLGLVFRERMAEPLVELFKLREDVPPPYKEEVLLLLFSKERSTDDCREAALEDGR